MMLKNLQELMIRNASQLMDYHSLSMFQIQHKNIVQLKH